MSFELSAVLAQRNTPDAPAVNRALRVQGPELAELMLNVLVTE